MNDAHHFDEFEIQHLTCGIFTLNQDGNTEFLCLGYILSEKLVISAAHAIQWVVDQNLPLYIEFAGLESPEEFGWPVKNTAISHARSRPNLRDTAFLWLDSGLPEAYVERLRSIQELSQVAWIPGGFATTYAYYSESEELEDIPIQNLVHPTYVELDLGSKAPSLGGKKKYALGRVGCRHSSTSLLRDGMSGAPLLTENIWIDRNSRRRWLVGGQIESHDHDGKVGFVYLTKRVLKDIDFHISRQETPYMTDAFSNRNRFTSHSELFGLHAVPPKCLWKDITSGKLAKEISSIHEIPKDLLSGRAKEGLNRRIAGQVSFAKIRRRLRPVDSEESRPSNYLALLVLRGSREKHKPNKLLLQDLFRTNRLRGNDIAFHWCSDLLVKKIKKVKHCLLVKVYYIRKT